MPGTTTPSASTAQPTPETTAKLPRRRRALLAAVTTIAAEPAFRLTDDEQRWANHFFAHARRIEDGMRRTMLDCNAKVVVSLAEKHPRHAATPLRLVAGGAK